ncbi:hypothetical protein B0H34DRAFT_703816 [Crassisporium funariophilum]|nr:hypothetical protein B0H34DRAFT_703816 [Crassisporium funariophilum]
MQVVDHPPAYSDHPDNAHHSARNVHPPPSVDQVHILERKHDIKGTFYIDPKVSALDQSRLKSKGKCKTPLPHASFRTRHGDIMIDLATTGNAWETPKANVVVASRTGHIKINLLSMPSSRPLIGLDITSRKGNIVLFLPPSYSGLVHLTTRKGTMDVLPALAGIMKVVKTTDKEVIFLVEGQNSTQEIDTSRETALCQLSTRTGNVIVGLGGRDRYTPPVGFWKRLMGSSKSEDT